MADLHKNILEDLPCDLPRCTISDNEDFATIAASVFKKFPRISANDFSNKAVWRDSMALTGTFRTFYSGTDIARMWVDLCNLRQAIDFSLDAASARLRRTPGNASWIVSDFRFQVANQPKATCFGSLFLIPTSNQDWKIWMITTSLDQLVGHPNVDELSPSQGTLPETAPSAVTGAASGPEVYFDAVIVGAGQAGLSVGGRLKALGVDYVVIDRMRNIGDNWLLRYDSTRLHTTREFAHLPFERTFSSTYQEYLTKYDIANGFQQWVYKYDINVWLSTNLEAGNWDAKKQLYTLRIKRGDKKIILNCRHVVIATGGYAPNISFPEYKNRDQFEGTVLHAAEYTDCSQWKGKKGIVIGTANTAHDVAEDMVEGRLSSVHMVQRNRTYVVPASHFKQYADELYNAVIPTHVADRTAYSMPWAVARLHVQDILHPLAADDPERFDSLEKAGFKTNRFGDLIFNLAIRRGGHYMDVGCSEKISNGAIKVKSDSLPVSYTPGGLQFADGSHLEADVIVFATGFSGNLTDTIEALFGSDVARNTETFWGVDNEGEIRGAFKPTGQPGLWCAAGTIGHARYHSRFIAMHIKADLDGVPFPVYDRTWPDRKGMRSKTLQGRESPL